jgi:hypothetical protein
MHALQEAGAAKLMTPELIATLADHALCRTRHSACYAAQRTMPKCGRDDRLFVGLAGRSARWPSVHSA